MGKYCYICGRDLNTNKKRCPKCNELLWSDKYLQKLSKLAIKCGYLKKKPQKKKSKKVMDKPTPEEIEIINKIKTLPILKYKKNGSIYLFQECKGLGEYWVVFEIEKDEFGNIGRYGWWPDYPPTTATFGWIGPKHDHKSIVDTVVTGKIPSLREINCKLFWKKEMLPEIIYDNSSLRRFEYKDYTSNKFWEIIKVSRGQSWSVETRWGKIGAKPQTNIKIPWMYHPGNRDATYNGLIQSKLNKGYEEIFSKPLLTPKIDKPILMVKDLGKQIPINPPALGKKTDFNECNESHDNIDLYTKASKKKKHRADLLEITDD